MHRSLPFRLTGALLALWLGVFQAEPTSLHICPTHSPVAGRATPSAVASHAGHAGHAMAAQMGAEMSMDEAAPAPTSDHSSHGGTGTCTCPDCCSAAVTVAVPTAPEASIITVAPRAAGIRWVDTAGLNAADPDHLRPFANGPPTA